MAAGDGNTGKPGPGQQIESNTPAARQLTIEYNFKEK